MEDKTTVRRVVLLVAGLLLMVLLVVAGCTRGVSPEKETVSSCISCHSDKDLLKQTAAPVEEVASAATSGEG